MPHVGATAKLEYSDLSGPYTEDDVTVVIEIFRPVGNADGWFLEVVISDEDYIRWDRRFATDQAAYDEVAAMIDNCGMRFFGTPPTEWIKPVLN